MACLGAGGMGYLHCGHVVFVYSAGIDGYGSAVLVPMLPDMAMESTRRALYPLRLISSV